MTVYQAVASFVPYDAVSEAARRFRDLLEPGVREPRVIAEGISRDLAREAIDYRAMSEGSAGDVIVYHVSTDSPLAEWLAGRPERLIVYYHNLTPAEFLAPFDPVAAVRLDRARKEAESLAEHADAAAAPSAYSLRELDAWGYRRTQVVPYPVAGREVRVDSPLARRLAAGKADGGGDVLFVGRLTPNKCQHDLLRSFALFRASHPKARLFLVGAAHLPMYELYLRRLASEIGVGDEAFVGSVSPGELGAYYSTADVLCSLSRHEGFGVPLVEAMTLGVPVVALAEAAVPETVADGGILLPDSGPALVAEVLSRVCGDADLRLELAEAGIERARTLSDTAVVRHALTELVAV